jgi:ribosomal protein L37E
MVENCKHCGKPTISFGDKTCSFCGAPVEQEKPFTLSSFLKQKHKIHPIDAVAGLIVFSVWIALSIGYVEAVPFGWGFLVGFAALWLVFVVVFRLVTGGILD